jgi:ATP-dependent DNA helicase DinG
MLIMDVNKHFSLPVIREMKRQIKNAGGNEVFFTGSINETGLVTSVTASARGTKDEAPVNFNDARSCSVLIHNHPGGNLEPSDADMAVASDASERAQGFYIVNNDVTAVYIVMEPVKPKILKLLDEDDTALYLADGGPLSKLSENFEERPIQIELLRHIVRSFNKNKLGVFEAGTGVGKSYAYLIPAMIWAVNNKERVVISTGTINLQQQLCEKDIPEAEKIVGKKIKAVLLKGRQNYICLRRLQDAGNERDLFSGDNEVLDKIASWSETSSTGSKSDLSFVPSESLWSRIKSESDACMGPRCLFHQNCFVMKVRKDAADANIIVVNHHLLFADIESRMNGAGYDDQAVLPPYRRIIFDEAHGIENAATSFFSESTNRFKIIKLLNLLYRKRKGNTAGYICTLAVLSAGEETADGAYELVNRVKADLTNLELASLDLLQKESTLRLFEGSARAFSPILSLVVSLSASISALTVFVHEIMEGIAEEDKEAGAYWEAKLALRRLDDTVKLFSSFPKWDEMRDTVFWIQKKFLPQDMVKAGENSAYTIFTETPLDIAALMNNGVFEPMESVVFTSATLAINRNFSYWMRRTGVYNSDEDRLVTGEFPSPFPYNKNLLFCVPSDVPLPDDIQGFQSYIENAVPRLILAAEGRTLVLFTSYESLKSVYRAAQSGLSGFQGTLLKQGDDDNAHLLDLFRSEKESVLFATDSFWQGIDVPGESLSQVIMVKLPFSVPNDPVFTARAEAVERRGGSSFMELSVPEAVMKFRQGVGRLIRRSDDRGTVVVLDRRIYEKRYGSIFLNSIPESKRMYEPLEKIVLNVHEFIFDR